MIITKGYGSRGLITRGYGYSIYTILIKAATRIFIAGVAMKQFTVDSGRRVFTKITDGRVF